MLSDLLPFDMECLLSLLLGQASGGGVVVVGCVLPACWGLGFGVVMLYPVGHVQGEELMELFDR